MANWCRSSLTVEGEKEHLDRFIEKAKGYFAAPLIGEEPNAEEAVCLDFNQFMPVPAEFLTNDAARDRWCEDNWHNSRSPHDADLDERSDVRAVFTFSTRNSPVLPVIEAMGQQFPMLRIYYGYAEPYGGFTGSWECVSGVMTGEHRPMPDGWRDSPDEPVASTQVPPPIQSLEPSAIQTEYGEPEISDEVMPF
jgi:hypothetical protein